MSRSSSPEAHWDRLESWLHTLTGNLLPEAIGDLQHMSREQLDDNLNDLMDHDPARDYSNKELAKIAGSLAHNLLAQARMSEASISRLEQEAAALKLQAEETQRDLTLAQSQLDQLKTQHQCGTSDEKDPDLQEEVERLQEALNNLRVDAARREQREKDAREELSEQLQHTESLLRKAETELKERKAKVKACEGHLQSARAGITALSQQRDFLKEELDIVHRELKHAYRLQGCQGHSGTAESIVVTAVPVQSTRQDTPRPPGRGHSQPSTQRVEPLGKGGDGTRAVDLHQLKLQALAASGQTALNMP
ncbi:hypothetical protein QQF64_016558 [Cirrhinus molitorella]|uniref:Uncharacterized protein n=1 Tax=Cirrhinus molitorella TaxID=172907 RepID=A0ABR3LN39_9TELE